MDNQELKSLVLQQLFAKFQPTNEQNANNHLTTEDFISVVGGVIDIEKEEMNQLLLDKGYHLGLYESKLGYWVLEALP